MEGMFELQKGIENMKLGSTNKLASTIARKKKMIEEMNKNISLNQTELSDRGYDNSS